MDVSCDWSSLNRLSSVVRPPAAGLEPDTTLPAAVREGTDGFDGGLELVGGALVPLVDCVNVGARGLVSGFGATAPRVVVTFAAVLDGWSGLAGRIAPTAGSFRGWSKASSSSSIIAFRLRLV